MDTWVWTQALLLTHFDNDPVLNMDLDVETRSQDGWIWYLLYCIAHLHSAENRLQKILCQSHLMADVTHIDLCLS